jgi:hypothetical protein
MRQETATALLVEFNEIKLASTRWQRELQDSVKHTTSGLGTGGDADAIARAASDLGLSPRYVRDISTGGAEGAVDLMAGRAPGAGRGESGLIARKLYNPESSITRGENTRELIKLKQRVSDAAEKETPGLFSKMYSGEELQTPRGLRHVSHHEYVPGVTPGHAIPSDREAMKHLRGQLDVVGRRSGTHVADAVIDIHENMGAMARIPMGETSPGLLGRLGFRGAVNAGNVVHDANGNVRVIDVLAAERGPFGKNPAMKQQLQDLVSATRGKPHVPGDIAKNVGMDAARKDIFQGAKPSLPALRPGVSRLANVGRLVARYL